MRWICAWPERAGRRRGCPRRASTLLFLLARLEICPNVVERVRETRLQFRSRRILGIRLDGRIHERRDETAEETLVRTVLDDVRHVLFLARGRFTDREVVPRELRSGQVVESKAHRCGP